MSARTAGDVWPSTADDLVRVQADLAQAIGPSFTVAEGMAIGGCFVCFDEDDRGWAAAVVMGGGKLLHAAVIAGEASAPYRPGFLALREGPLLEAAVDGVGHEPDVLLVNATGRDHPRRAGLALHLGAIVGVPTVGATHRPLLSQGEWPDDEQGARSPLLLEGDPVGFWLRTRRGARPLAVHAAWCTTPETAAAVVTAAAARVRTPEPLRQARRLARRARSGHDERVGFDGAGTLPPPW